MPTNPRLSEADFAALARQAGLELSADELAEYYTVYSEYLAPLLVRLRPAAPLEQLVAMPPPVQT